jgi:hypothetical protein
MCHCSLDLELRHGLFEPSLESGNRSLIAMHPFRHSCSIRNFMIVKELLVIPKKDSSSAKKYSYNNTLLIMSAIFPLYD